jgi:hypothetical protein
MLQLLPICEEESEKELRVGEFEIVTARWTILTIERRVRLIAHLVPSRLLSGLLKVHPSDPGGAPSPGNGT